MGRYKVTIRLLVACCICGIFLRLECEKKPSANQRRPDYLLPFLLKDVNAIHMTLASGREINLESSPSGWNMVAPSRSRASIPAVQQMLDAFEQAPLHETIDLEDQNLRELTMADFGFDNPVGRITFSGPSFRYQLVFGDCDSVTNGLFVFDSTGQRRDPDQKVRVTAPSLREFFLKTPEHFMDRRVFQCNMSMVHTVILRRPALGDLKLVRDAKNRHQWNIADVRLMKGIDDDARPIVIRADWDVVGRFFDILSAATFIDNYQDGSTPQTGGFDQNESPSITLFSKNDLAGQTLFIGDRVPGDADLAYARGPAGFMTVTGAVRRLVLAPAYDFRDRRLFPATEPIEVQSFSIDHFKFDTHESLSLRRSESGWDVTAPVSAAAEPSDVAALLDSLLSLRAERFMPFNEQDAKNIASATLVLGRDRKPFSFSVYMPDSEDGQRYGILPGGSDAMYLVPGKSFYTNVLTYCTDPRPLISRTVLAINEDHVRAVSISGIGAETQRIEKVAGEWKSATPGRQTDEVTVRRFFAAAASIRADWVTSLAPTMSRPLDGGVEIPFDMDDGASLRRILTIGPRQEDGYPAAVKGRDTIFILSPETVSGLTQSFFVPEDLAPTEAPANPTITDKDPK